MILNTTLSPISRQERNKINENWQRIIAECNRLQSQINILSGDVSVEEILQALEDAIANANDTVAALEQQVQQSITDNDTATQQAIDNLNSELQSALTNISNKLTEMQTAITNAETATTNANTATSDALIATSNALDAITNMQNFVSELGMFGVYDPTATYDKNNMVRYEKAVYIALKDGLVGVTPTDDGVNWRLLIRDGVDGQGAVSTVNGVSPDENGNVELTPSSIGAASQTDLETTNNNLATAEQTLTAHLVESKNLGLIGSLKYGKMELPSDFEHNLNFDLYRDVDGKIKHTFNFESLTSDYTIFYIDGVNGIQSNNGTTKETPKKNVYSTIQEIESNPSITKAKLIILGDYIERSQLAISDTYSITKDYAIVGEKENVYAGSIEPALSWTDEGNGVYSATRSSAAAVFDTTVKSIYGLPTKYIELSTLAECQATFGSWYTDGSKVYVHRLNNSIPIQGEIFVTVQATTLQPNIGSNVTFSMKNFTLLSNTISKPCFFSSVDGSGKVILDNITLHSSSGTSANGIACDNLASMWLFNCKAIDIARDGFNYHATLGGNCFIFEYNCLAENCGVNDTNSINNCTTAHEGMSILRVGSVGRKSKGPVLADIQGCYSICVDCNMNESLIDDDTADNKTAFRFEDLETNDGKVVLINCSGGDSRTKGISCDDISKTSGRITIENFVGKNIPSDIVFNII
ncbi:hypothetical protein MTP04_22360 [Lysinibacillus sp. PLM2]|nr:hypothetical protein MTP04_22360 [Lysinibacillus sp. PLM2]